MIGKPQNNSVESITQPLEYLVIGHVTEDLTPTGSRLGGTATFSALTAHALGLKAGIISSYHPDLDTTPLQNLFISNYPAEHTTTFKNISDGVHRQQYLFQRAHLLGIEDIPSITPPPKIVHLGPVANEIDPQILSLFPGSFKCLTPQGWFRQIGADNLVQAQTWKDSDATLAEADVAVISLEDVQYDERIIARMAGAIPVFVVTENFKGARVYWHNDARYFKAPKVKYEDDTGAGDIFAAAFFIRYLRTRDPWEAGRFAVLIASWSVTHQGLASIPSAREIEQAKIEVLGH